MPESIDSNENIIGEIEELLDDLENNLMNYVEELKKNDIPASLIHTLFRAAHNLKSLLAFIHKEQSSRLMHLLENHFDNIRYGRYAKTSLPIDIFLKSLDLIRTDLKTEETAPEELEQMITLITSSENSEPKKPEAQTEKPLSFNQQALLTKAKADKNNIFYMEKLINTNVPPEEIMSLPIFQTIQKLGILISISPDIARLDKSKKEEVLNIVFGTSKTKAEVEEDIFDPIFPFTSPEPERKNEIKILIAEQDFTTRHELQQLMSEFGDCFSAVNGKEALTAFTEGIKTGNRLHLIILDIMMPVMNGLETLTALRLEEASAGIIGKDRTIVFITSIHADTESAMMAFKEQADAYIVKPLTKEKVIKELKKASLILQASPAQTTIASEINISLE